MADVSRRDAWRWRDRRGSLRRVSPYRTRLTASTLAAYVGTGVYTTCSAVYFTRSVGIPVTSYGMGMSVAGLLAIASCLPVGLVCDRLGARNLCVATSMLQAGGFLAAALAVHSVWSFLADICLLVAAENAGIVAWNALIADAAGYQERAMLAARLRTVQNIGMSLGLLIASVGLAMNSRPVYVSLMLMSAVMAVGKAKLVRKVPVSPRAALTHPEPVPDVARDVPYLCVSLVSGCLSIGDVILSVGLPVWIISHTVLPRVTIGILLAMNTVTVIMFQVSASRTIQNISQGSVAQSRGLLLTGVACIVIMLTGFRNGVLLTAAAAVLAVMMLSIAELFFAAASWILRFDLAVESAQGGYSGLFTLGSGIKIIAGPAAVTVIPNSFGILAWGVLGLVFLGLIPISKACVSWCERTRPACG